MCGCVDIEFGTSVSKLVLDSGTRCPEFSTVELTVYFGLGRKSGCVCCYIEEIQGLLLACEADGGYVYWWMVV